MPFIEPRYVKCIQIELTNACNMRCAHCSRLMGHHTKSFFLTEGQVEQALKTLVDFPGHVGFIGGEPTLHPQFEKMCKLMQKYQFVKARRELWTNGAKFDEHRKIIEETFYPELISYNEHEVPQPCWHQPLQVAIDEVFNGSFHSGKGLSKEEREKLDRELMWKIINNCWIQNRWSPSITPMGAYYCETAAARAMLFGGPKGIPVESGWWKRPQKDWEYQRELCLKCSACLPMPMVPNDKQTWDDVSPIMLKKLNKLDSPKCAAGNCKVMDIESLREYYKGHTFEPEEEYRERGSFKDFPKWKPWRYRVSEEIKHSPEDVMRMAGERKVVKGIG